MTKQMLALGMGCFWGPEAWIGALHGVLRTRTGLAGGQQPDPVYRQPADHSEVVQIEYDDTILPLASLLEQFWRRHRPAAIHGYREGARYRSLLLCSHEEQLQLALHMQAMDAERAETTIRVDTTFYPVEERHQKYYLQRQPEVVEQLVQMYDSRTAALDTRLAARLNGWSRGERTVEQLRSEVKEWQEPLSPEMKQHYERLLNTLPV